MKIKFILAWYDLWVGIYVHVKHCKVYILPFPCIGICIDYSDLALKRRNKWIDNEIERLETKLNEKPN